MRTDIHAPGHQDFDPAAYTLVDVYDLQDVAQAGTFGPSDQELFSRAVEALQKRGITRGSHAFGCGHCGQANLRYVALLVRADVNEWIIVGQDCLSNRFTDMTAEKFKAIQKRAAESRAAQKLRIAFEALCETSQVLTYATYARNISFSKDQDDVYGWEIDTIADIARKARQYGSVSDKQLAFIERLWDKADAKWAAHLVAKAEKAANPAGPAPLGRQVVEGEIVSLKTVEGDYGTTFKMLVKLDNGAKVWGTEPSSISPERGDRVQFTATFEPSAADESFGYFKRPTKAAVLPFQKAA